MTTTSQLSNKIANSVAISLAAVLVVGGGVMNFLYEGRRHLYEGATREAVISKMSELEENAIRVQDVAVRVQSIAYFDLLTDCMLSGNMLGTSRLDKAITAMLPEQPLRGEVNQEVVLLTIENVERECNANLLRDIAAANPHGALALAAVLREQGLHIPEAYQDPSVQMAALDGLVLPQPVGRP